MIRSIRFVIYTLVALLLLPSGLLPCASAEKSAAEFIRPIVSHHQYTVLVTQLDTDRDQRTILEFMFDDYLAGIEAVRAEADQAADAVGRQLVLDAFSGRRVVPVDELRQLRKDVLEVYQSYLHEADVQFEIMLSSVRSVLNERQRPSLDAPARRLRRELYLHPGHANRHAYEYAGEGVDVLRLVEDAMRDGGELEAINDDALKDVLDEYAYALDQVLMEIGPAMRKVRMDERIARIAQDEAAKREAEQQFIRLWQRLYEFNLDVVERIADIVESELGESPAHEWRMRYDEACFAWLFAPALPDRQYEWIVRQSLTDRQREQIEAAYAEYQEQRRLLCRDTIDIMLEARMEQQTILYPMMDPSGLSGRVRQMYEQLLRQSGEQSALAASASSQLESILTDHQRTTLRRTVRPRRGR